MPIREYGCQNQDCGHVFEVIANHCTEDLTKCPECGEESLVRLFSNTAPPKFKGTGWYDTDYKRKN